MLLYLQYAAKALNCEQIFLQAGLASTPCCNVQKEEADGDLTLANIDCNRGCQFPLRIGKGAQETDRGNSRRIKSVMCIWGGVEGVTPLQCFQKCKKAGQKTPLPLKSISAHLCMKGCFYCHTKHIIRNSIPMFYDNSEHY